MNWYLKHIVASIGEWWIHDGSATFADGDIGDSNHEAIVIQYAQSQIADGYEDYEEWKISTVQEILENEKAELEQQKASLEENEEIKENQIDARLHEIWEMSRDVDYYAYDIIVENLEKLGIDSLLFHIAEGMRDGRLYAKKVLGWKRVENNNIETYTLTAQDLASIAGGLDNILNDEEVEISFNIYVDSTGQWYNDVSLEDIMNKNLSAITGQTEQTETSQAYQNAFEQQDKPTSSYYRRWGD